MTTPTLPEGYRLMNYGEFIPGNAIYYSNKGCWRPTPCAGKQYAEGDGFFACHICETGTMIGSEAVSDSTAAHDAPPYGYDNQGIASGFD